MKFDFRAALLAACGCLSAQVAAQDTGPATPSPDQPQSEETSTKVTAAVTADATDNAAQAGAGDAGLQGSDETSVPPVPTLPVRRVGSGVPLTLMIMTEVDSNRAQPGTPIKLRLHEPVVADGFVVIPKGAAATGEVVSNAKSGLTLKKGTITIRMKELAYGDRRFPMSTELVRKGKGGKADDALKVILVPIYALFAPGNSARLKAGELLTAPIDQDICFTTSDQGAAVVDCPPTEQAPTEQEPTEQGPPEREL